MISNGVPKTTMKKMGDSLKPDQIHKLIALYPQPGTFIGREHLEALHCGGSQRRGTNYSSISREGSVRRSAIASGAKEAGSVRLSIASPAAALRNSSWSRSFSHRRRSPPSTRPSPSPRKTGQVITGLRVNETNFSIQLHEENGRFHSLLKRDLDEVKVLKKSLMPENLAEVLTVKELHDLFAYLMTLE